MIEIYPDLYVGNQLDYEYNVKLKKDWAVVQACREPYHREALSYQGIDAPNDHSEYLFAKRENRLILNLIDIDSESFIVNNIIDTALKFIDDNLANGLNVLVHCNLGMSRSAGIAMLFLASKGIFAGKTMAEAEANYKLIYPPCSLSRGMFDYININWNKYNCNS